MSKVSVVVGMLFASVSVVAHADGRESDYDHGEPALARSLAPNEYLINADGAQEDPQHRMSDTARAYRNGLIAGRKEEAERQAKVPPLPPLPHTVSEDDGSRYTSIPPQPQLQHVQAPPPPQMDSAPRMAAQVPRPPVHVPPQQSVAWQEPQAQPVYQQEPPAAPQAGWAPVRQAAWQQQPRVQYVQTQNVYPQSGFAYANADDAPAQAYAPPPPPAPVYVASADTVPAQYAQYVYAPPPDAPVMIVRRRRPAYRPVAVNYWQPGYVTRYADQPTYAYYQPGW